MPKLIGIWEMRFVAPTYVGPEGMTVVKLVPGVEVMLVINGKSEMVTINDETIEMYAAFLQECVEVAIKTLVAGKHLWSCRPAIGCTCQESIETLRGKTRTAERTMLIRLKVM